MKKYSIPLFLNKTTCVYKEKRLVRLRRKVNSRMCQNVPDCVRMCQKSESSLKILLIFDFFLMNNFIGFVIISNIIYRVSENELTVFKNQYWNYSCLLYFQELYFYWNYSCEKIMCEVWHFFIALPWCSSKYYG